MHSHEAIARALPELSISSLLQDDIATCWSQSDAKVKLKVFAVAGCGWFSIAIAWRFFFGLVAIFERTFAPGVSPCFTMFHHGSPCFTMFHHVSPCFTCGLWQLFGPSRCGVASTNQLEHVFEHVNSHEPKEVFDHFWAKWSVPVLIWQRHPVTLHATHTSNSQIHHGADQHGQGTDPTSQEPKRFWPAEKLWIGTFETWTYGSATL